MYKYKYMHLENYRETEMNEIKMKNIFEWQLSLSLKMDQNCN